MAEEKSPLKWKFKTGGSVHSSPAVVDGVVYFGSADSHLYALDTKTGEEKWKFEAGDRIWSSPTVLEGVVYFGSNDNHLYALDTKTGKEKWKFKATNWIRSSPAVSGGVVYFGSDYDLYALDSKTGHEKWKFQTGGWVKQSPVVSEGIVYFGSDDNHLYAVDTKSGKQKWKFKTGESVASTPAVLEGMVYFGSNDNHLYALDTKTGKEKWKFQTGKDVFSSPTVSDGVVYFGNKDRIYSPFIYHLYAVDAKTGKEKWKFDTGDYVQSSPAVLDGVVYFGSNDNHLYAIDIITGEEKWKFKTGDRIWSSPTVLEGVVYFGSNDNHLYAVDIEIASVFDGVGTYNSHWKPHTEMNLKKIRELMVSSQFEAGIELAQTVDDPYLLLELVDGCKIEEDGTITLNETFDINAAEEDYDILVSALFKILLKINDIQKPDSSLKIEHIKSLALHSFVKLPSGIAAFTSLETIWINPKHSKSIPKEYYSIKDLQIKIVITYEDLLKAVFGEDDEYPDFGTPASDIRESDLIFNVPLNIAEKIAGQWGGGWEPEWEGLKPDDIVKYVISADEVLNTSHFGKDFCCHFTDMKLDQPSKWTNEDGEEVEVWGIGDGVNKRESLEKWINLRLKNAIKYFNRFTVLGNWGAGVSAEESKSAIFCNFELKKNYSLSDINPDWTDDEYFLEGFEDIERDSRIDTFDNW